MPDKKWYSFFVSVEDPAASASPPPPGPSGSDGSAARMIAEIAASIQPPTEQQFAKPLAAAATKAATPATAVPAAPLSFQEIYGAAEIAAPPHGYTILKVADMLQNEHIRQLPAEVKRSSILVALDAAGVKVQEIIQDAIRRDKALDTFESMQLKQLGDLESSKLEENRKIQADVDKYVNEQKLKMQANNDAVYKRKESLSAWRMQKQIEEQKIFETVSYFVSENPVTTAGRGRPPPPPPPHSAPRRRKPVGHITMIPNIGVRQFRMIYIFLIY
jgi:hypothetical protein